MTIFDQIASFLEAGPYGVVGASDDRSKYGNKVLRCYLQHALVAHPIHPTLKSVEGRTAYPTLADVPGGIRAASIITPPKVTEKIVDQAIALNIRHLWMQPGAESDAAIARAEKAGISVIARGACILVVLGYRER